jgi:WD domain, G-beta repeat
MEHPDGVRAAQFNPDGRLILTGGDDGTARLWHTDSGQIIGRPLQHAQGVCSVAFAPDGRTLATGSAAAALAGEARIWDTATGQPLTAPLRHPIRCVAWRGVQPGWQNAPDRVWGRGCLHRGWGGAIVGRRQLRARDPAAEPRALGLMTSAGASVRCSAQSWLVECRTVLGLARP